MNKKINNIQSKLIAMVLALALMAMPMAINAQVRVVSPNENTQTQNQNGNDGGWGTGYAEGQMSGKAAGKGAWYFAGCLFGIVGVAIAYVVTPSPSPTAIMGKSTEYVLGYNDGFKKAAAKKNATSACYGLATTGVAYVILVAAATSADTGY